MAALLSLVPTAMGFAAGAFTGDFDLGAPATYFSSGTAGKWSVNIDTAGGTASVSTASAPSSVSLFAEVFSAAASSRAAPAGLGPSLYAISQIFLTAPTDGTFSFDVIGTVSPTAGSQGKVYAFLGATQYSLLSESTYTLTLSAGDTFGFGAEAFFPPPAGPDGGRASPAGLPGLADVPLGSNLNISNVVFTPVPEASTISAGIALLGMGAFAWQRSRRRP